jgi:hypothetical protein
MIPLARFKCKANTSGSISLEAAMIFPWVVMITLLLLLFALFVSQRALLYYSSSVTAERTAFGWSNSAKDTHTGAFPEGKYDGLYWRLTEDSLVQGLFGLVSEKRDVIAGINSESEGSNGSSAEDKLRKYSVEPASSHKVGNGEIRYENIGIQRKVAVELSSTWNGKPLNWLLGRGEAESEVSALIVEPAEFLRSFDLVRYYATKMKGAEEGESEYRDKAGGVLRKRKP